MGEQMWTLSFLFSYNPTCIHNLYIRMYSWPGHVFRKFPGMECEYLRKSVFFYIINEIDGMKDENQSFN